MNRPELIWLSARVLTALVAEADKSAPLETGGILLGFWAEENSEPVVLEMLGPGPNAIHERYRFVPDHEHQTAEIERLYHDSGRRLHYLGDWHTHPGGSATLSKSDRATLRQIAAEPAARAPMPTMLILAPGPSWKPSAWCGVLTGRVRFWQRLVAWAMEVRIFDDVNVHPTGLGSGLRRPAR